MSATVHTVLAVPDMHCAACVGRIEAVLEALPGISRFSVNPTRRQVIVSHDQQRLPPAELLQHVRRGDASARLADLYRTGGVDRAGVKRLGVAGVLAMQIMMLALAGYLDTDTGAGLATAHVGLLRHVSLLFSIPLVVYCAAPFFVNAWRSLRTGQLRGASMDLPVAVAIGIAFSSSAVTTVRGDLAADVWFDSVAMFVFLLLLARFLADRLRMRFEVDDQLADLVPRTCLRINPDGEHLVASATLVSGDRVRVLRGDALPADGTLCSASAWLDEAVLTGESLPVTRTSGAALYAATTNCGAPLELLVTAPAATARFRQIAQLADAAGASASVEVQLADRLARVFVATVMLLAACTWLYWQWQQPQTALAATLAVLVVACPCALSLATPAAVTAALLRLRRAGVVVTRASVLGQLGSVGRVFFDKTGTLTAGQPQLRAVYPGGSMPAERCVALAAALQRHASHPWARAFADDHTLVAADVDETPGAGVAGMVDGLACRIGSADFCGLSAHQSSAHPDANVWLCAAGDLLAAFRVEDQLRPGSLATIDVLRAAGLRPTLLSGDQGVRCAAFAEHMQVVSGLTPQDKHAVLSAAGCPAMMVGDGINDLPVMAAADVSVAFLDARAMVRGRADVLLLGSGPEGLLVLLDVAAACMRIVHQNLGWALAWNLVAIPAAAAGMIPPWLAAAGMSASSLLVTLNATRLLGERAGLGARHALAVS